MHFVKDECLVLMVMEWLTKLELKCFTYNYGLDYVADKNSYFFSFISKYCLFAIFIFFSRMTIQEVGSSDVVLDSLARCLGKNPSDIKVCLSSLSLPFHLSLLYLSLNDKHIYTVLSVIISLV